MVDKLFTKEKLDQLVPANKTDLDEVSEIADKTLRGMKRKKAEQNALEKKQKEQDEKKAMYIFNSKFNSNSTNFINIAQALRKEFKKCCKNYFPKRLIEFSKLSHDLNFSIVSKHFFKRSHAQNCINPF